LHHLARAVGRQVEVNAGVVFVGWAKVASEGLDNSGYGVEQADKVDAGAFFPDEP